MEEIDPTLISHIGIAVRDLETSVKAYRLLTGIEPVIHDVPDQKVRVAMFGSEPDQSRIELVAPTATDSPIASYLERKGEGLHHICIYVTDIESKLGELRASGVKLIDDVPRIGADGHPIAFVHPSGGHGVLIELEQRP